MHFKPAIFLSTFIGLMLPLFAVAQKNQTAKTPKAEVQSVKSLEMEASMVESNAILFKPSGSSPDTAKATLRVRVLERGGDAQPIQGATVLLRRDEDQMLGRVTKNDGRCLFSSIPATYTVRVQMTGLKSVEKTGYVLDAGQAYDMEIFMTKN